MTNFEFAFNVIRNYENIEDAFNNTNNPKESKAVFLSVVNKKHASD